MSEEMTRRPTPSSPADDDDLLREIILRLPPQPSSLPRASLVCKRWRRLLSDPGFLRRFRAHHRTPPLLGFLHFDSSVADGVRFVSTLDPPDRIPASRFYLDPQGAVGTGVWRRWPYLSYCQGLVLGWNRSCTEFLVFDPMAGHRRRVPFSLHRGSVLLFAVAVPVADDRCLFRLVALLTGSDWGRAFASVYSSESGVWAHSVSSESVGSAICLLILRPSTLVGNAIYWFLADGGILQFDLDRQSLTFLETPLDANLKDSFKCQIMPAEDGRLGLAVLAELSIQFWERETDCDSPAKWVLRKTVQSDKFLPLGCSPLSIVGYAEESNVIFLRTDDGVFMIHLESMQFRKVLGKVETYHILPYSSF